jgi:hypothetical protein
MNHERRDDTQNNDNNRLPPLRSLQLGAPIPTTNYSQNDFLQQQNNNYAHVMQQYSPQTTTNFNPVSEASVTTFVATSTPEIKYCTVRIVSGKYDEIGNCFLDEGQKKIEVEVETNLDPKSVTLLCDKEGYGRTPVVTIKNIDFVRLENRLIYRHRFVSGFPVKSGVTHSQLRFVAEVTEHEHFYTFIGKHTFYC